ncbi:FKBP-type peptidyl-prolyl cis-trans isomerase [Novosphingobium sp.]|uniref:FKBP-type peptidyl-prolyl cis-trans isomerase n=1 Tax=Novosphingobium sp. TaxID=1874826 RepID=UPI0025FC3430|nr:FKBP-type peptidyl-prolyl cis-trans isomerase [Novosphingobium sp.]
MTEITRVPLQPIAKGSTTRIWVGVGLAFALALVLAFVARFHGLVVDTIKAGTGASPTAADVVLVNYVGHLGSGKEFDKGDKVAIPLDAVVPGFSQGLQKMQKGGKYKLSIPANLGYGPEPQKNNRTGEVVIPGNSDLVFDIELLDYMNAAQLRQLQQMQMQQLQGMRGKGGPGAPHGGPAGMPQGAMPPGAMPPGDLPPGAMPPSGPGGQ